MKMTRQQWRRTARQAQDLVLRGEKITAIKFLRDQVGCGLKEAYDAVTKLEAIPRNTFRAEDRQ